MKARTTASLLTALLLILSPTLSNAQTAFRLQQLRPGSDPHGILNAMSARTLGQWRYSVGMWLNYAKDPLILRQDGKKVGEIVSSQLGIDLGASLGVLSWLDISLALPLTWIGNASLPVDSRLGSNSGRELSSFSVEDPAISLKLRILDEKRHGVSLAVIPTLTIPLGNSDVTRYPTEDQQRHQSFHGASSCSPEDPSTIPEFGKCVHGVGTPPPRSSAMKRAAIRRPPPA